MKTELTICGENFLINGVPVYAELPDSNPQMHGLLMNARLIQGIFDDTVAPERFSRFGMVFDAQRNTDELCAALPQWYRCGLRAFTVGLQGGGPCHTVPNSEIVNNPFSPDGLHLDEKYMARLKKLLDAADEVGMAVIVSILYGGQIRHLNGDDSVRNAVRTACAWLRGGGWTNVIVEPANEYDNGSFRDYPVVNSPRGAVELMELARQESGLPVGCSGCGGTFHAEVAVASDVVLIHGNGLSRQRMSELVRKARAAAPGKPIVCNEDSQAIGNLQVCMDAHVSWGYYNAFTKQELATDWGVCRGEDEFFAMRMAENIGLPFEKPGFEDSYRLIGTGKNECWEGKCWPRIAALYPETVDCVDYYLNGEKIYRSYDEPFSLYFVANWRQNPLLCDSGCLRAEIRLADGRVLVREAQIGE